MAWLHYSLSLTDEQSVIATDAQSRDAISTLSNDLPQTQPYIISGYTLHQTCHLHRCCRRRRWLQKRPSLTQRTEGGPEETQTVSCFALEESKGSPPA